MAPTRWKPPIWLIALDIVAAGLLFLGIALYNAPEGGTLAGLPPTLAIPLLVVGGALLAFCSLVAVRLVLAHRRG